MVGIAEDLKRVDGFIGHGEEELCIVGEIGPKAQEKEVRNDEVFDAFEADDDIEFGVRGIKVEEVEVSGVKGDIVFFPVAVGVVDGFAADIEADDVIGLLAEEVASVPDSTSGVEEESRMLYAIQGP